MTDSHNMHSVFDCIFGWKCKPKLIGVWNDDEHLAEQSQSSILKTRQINKKLLENLKLVSLEVCFEMPNFCDTGW